MIDFKLSDDLDISYNSDGEIETVDTIETALPCALFYQKRINDQRGYFGFDNLEGSKLWLLEQSRVSTQILNDNRLYADNALSFLITDGLATSVENKTSLGNDNIFLNTKISTVEKTNIDRKFNL